MVLVNPTQRDNREGERNKERQTARVERRKQSRGAATSE